MGKKNTFTAEPNPVLCALAKVLEAKRDGENLVDKSRKLMQPGQYRLQGQLIYDMLVNVGEDSNAARFFGVPIDSILLLSLHYCGALRKHFFRAAKVVVELRTAELEDRKVCDVQYDFTNDDGTVESITISAKEIKEQADVIAGKLVGTDEETTKAEQQRRALIQQAIAEASARLKVVRKYQGPVNVEEAGLSIVEVPVNERIAA